MSEGEDRNTVTLGSGDGEETYKVKAQPYPVLFRQLAAFGDELQQLGELGTDDLQSLVVALGGRVHEFIRIFIPNVMAQWQFQGFPSRDAFEAGKRDEESEKRAPTIPQIRAAVEAGFRVNELTDIGALLGKLLGPGMKGALQQLMAATVGEFMSQGSTNSPSQSDGATPDGSTVASPTPGGDVPPTAPSIPGPASAASPSLVSSP